jgi:nitroimidazol reductase NimA-like FMN-containing flavoprotein (pyridoxamine 5'-phosphate oxidase superfamily)
MHHEMRRSDRQLNIEDVKQILESGEYGILSTVGENGYPYGVPVSYVAFDSKIFFHCATGVGMKLENIALNEKVSFTVVGKTEVLAEKFSTKYESIIAFGTAKLSADLKLKALEEILRKYSSEFMEKGLQYVQTDHHKTDIYEITIEEITGKARR